jgi:arsenate reductase
MSTIIYHNPRCSKSRKALELLYQHQQYPRIIDYLETPPDANTLKQLLAKLKITARDLLRSKEKEYQLAGLDDESLSDDDIIAAMVKCPILIERPIIVIGEKAIIGRPPEKILELLEKAHA